MNIRLDDLTGKEVIHLINSHFQNMTAITPIESVHALQLEDLQKPNITFWSAWDRHDIMGCGALKEIDSYHGEVKSMRTSSDYLRRGVAKRILEHIIAEAKKRGYKQISLETGSHDAFVPARKLYESFGFQYCEPFGDYKEDYNSVFMTMKLNNL